MRVRIVSAYICCSGIIAVSGRTLISDFLCCYLSSVCNIVDRPCVEAIIICSLISDCQILIIDGLELLGFRIEPYILDLDLESIRQGCLWNIIALRVDELLLYLNRSYLSGILNRATAVESVGLILQTLICSVIIEI